MNTQLEQAKQSLRAAESCLAQLTGESKAVDAQVETLNGQLQQLGIDPAQADVALEAINAELVKVEQELAEAAAQLELALQG